MDMTRGAGTDPAAKGKQFIQSRITNGLHETVPDLTGNAMFLPRSFDNYNFRHRPGLFPNKGWGQTYQPPLTLIC